MLTDRFYNLWSAKEDEALYRLYPDYEALCRALPSRSYCAIQRRISKLGISKKRKTWTARDLSNLRKFYPDEEWHNLKRIFPGRTANEIRCRAVQAGITRALKETGIDEIDAIRYRARAVNLTMLDVDMLARTNLYFARHRWLTYVDWRAIHRAIKALGGDIHVAWSAYRPPKPRSNYRRY